MVELSKGSVEIELLIPYAAGDVVDRVYRLGEVLKRADEAEGSRITARIPSEDVERFTAYLVV